jgi:hypothetical protein
MNTDDTDRNVRVANVAASPTRAASGLRQGQNELLKSKTIKRFGAKRQDQRSTFIRDKYLFLS